MSALSRVGWFWTFALLSLVSCGPKNEDPAPQTSYFEVTGDPIGIIEGTDRNKGAVLIPQSFFGGDQDWSLQVSGFVEAKVDMNQRQSQESVELENKTADGTALVPSESFKTRRSGDLVQLVGSIGAQEISFAFRSEEGGYSVQSISIQGSNYAKDSDSARVEHISFRGDFISILVYFGGSPASLISFVFEKKSGTESWLVKAIGSAKLHFEYLLGTGIKAGWDQSRPLQISVCGSRETSSFPEFVKGASRAWVDLLKNRLDIKWEFAEQCAPFSDLNQNSIQLVQKWLAIKSSSHQTLAVTLPVISVNKPQFAQVNVLFFWEVIQWGFKRHIGRSLPFDDFILTPKGREYYEFAAKHEFGHVLGLGHQFNKKYQSVMAYSSNQVNDPSAHDREALYELYPLRGDEATPDQRTQRF